MKITAKTIRVAALVLGLTTLLPNLGEAAQVTTRSITLGSSAASAVNAHTIAFTVATGGNVGSMKFEYCTTAYSACVTPTGLLTTAASLSAQSGAAGFSMVNTTNGAPYITRGSANIPAATPVSYTLGSITNPSATNTQYWVRITTYVSIDTTGGFTDDGVVVFDTAQQITVTGTMPESLVFCVGTSGTDCTNMTGSSVALGTFSPVATNSGTSLMSASTNAGLGYSITVTGTTLTSGANNIPAMGTQALNSNGCVVSCTSTTGTSQFGSNVRANTSPAVGANVSGTGTGAGAGGYNTPDAFRWFNGDTVAATAGVSSSNLYTNSYIVNVGGDQAAGTYTATMTYICTATF